MISRTEQFSSIRRTDTLVGAKPKIDKSLADLYPFSILFDNDVVFEPSADSSGDVSEDDIDDFDDEIDFDEAEAESVIGTPRSTGALAIPQYPWNGSRSRRWPSTKSPERTTMSIELFGCSISRPVRLSSRLASALPSAVSSYKPSSAFTICPTRRSLRT